MGSNYQASWTCGHTQLQMSQPVFWFQQLMENTCCDITASPVQQQFLFILQKKNHSNSWRNCCLLRKNGFWNINNLGLSLLHIVQFWHFLFVGLFACLCELHRMAAKDLENQSTTPPSPNWHYTEKKLYMLLYFNTHLSWSQFLSLTDIHKYTPIHTACTYTHIITHILCSDPLTNPHT